MAQKRNRVLFFGKLFFSVLLVLSLILTSFSFAAEAPFEITSVTISDKSATVEGNIDSFADGVIKDTLIYHKQGDYAVYEIALKNNLTSDITISQISDNNENEYITYEYDDHRDNTLKSGQALALSIKAIYSVELTDLSKRAQTNNVKFTISYIENGEEKTAPISINPKTGDDIILNVVMVAVSTAGLIICIALGKKKSSKLVAIIIVAIAIGPIAKAASSGFVFALDTTIGIYDKQIVTYDIDGEQTELIVSYGETATLPENPEKAGYTFKGWKDENDEDFDQTKPIEGDKNIHAVFEANTNTAYTVTHNIMNLDGTTYFEKAVQHLTGTTDTPVTPSVNDYEGFTAPATKTATIKGDGSTVVDYYYTRNQYRLTVEDSQYIEEGDISGNYYYGAQLTLTAGKRKGYAFEQWSNGSTDSQLVITIGTADVTIGTQWREIIATLKPGYDVNSIIKTLANRAARNSGSSDEKVKTIQFVDSLPDTIDPESARKANIALDNSEPVYAYEGDNGSYYIYSDANVVYANEESRRMFIGFGKTESLSFSDSFNTSKVTDMSQFFAGLGSLQSLDIPESFDTSNVTDMFEMFRGLKLTTLSLPESFSTAKAKDMRYMFCDMTSLTSLTLPNSFDTSNAERMDAMFENVKSLTSLTLPDSFDTSNVTSMSIMFRNMRALTSLSLPASFNTSKVTNMNAMFASDVSLKTLTLPDSFITTNVTNMASMFYEMISLTSLTLPNSFDTSNVTDMSSMFNGDKKLTSLTLPDSFNTSKVTDMTAMFSGTAAMKTLVLPDSFDTSNVTRMGSMFNGASSLKELNLPDSFDTSKVRYMSGMFRATSSLTSLSFPDSFVTSEVTDMSYMFNGMASLKSLVLPNTFITSKVTNMNYMFGGLYALKTLVLPETFDTSNVTAMEYMFYNTSSLTTLELPNSFDTSSVTDMKWMFASMYSLTTLHLPDSFNAKSAMYMRAMFASCRSLTALNLPATFNTSNVVNMDQMFEGVAKVQTLELPDSFNTSKVTSMSSMFQSMASLTTLRLPESFDTSKVTSMSSMFAGLSSMTSLELPNSFVTSNVTSMYSMFGGMSSLEELTLSDTFNTSKVNNMSQMFENMRSLTSLTLPDTFTIGESTSVMNTFKGVNTAAVLHATDAKARSLWPGVVAEESAP